MKKITLSLIVFSTIIFSANSTKAQAPVKATEKTEIVNGPVLEVDKDTHDYGTIEKGGNGTCYFTITNTGTEPLIISHAQGSCGCTVPEWPKEPILPGMTVQMKVNYDTKRLGDFQKTVTVTSNASNTPSKIVFIKGKVVDAEATSASPLKN